MKKQIGYKLYVVRTYIKARDASEALRKYKTQKPDDVYVSDDWKESKNNQLASAIGFESYPPEADTE